MSLEIVSFGSRTGGSGPTTGVREEDWGRVTTYLNYDVKDAEAGKYEHFDGAIFASFKVSKTMMLALKNARAITRYGAGVNELDPHAASELNKLIVSTHSYGPETVAEHADRLLLAARGWMPWMHHLVSSGAWHDAGSYLTDTVFAATSECTLGIVGLGEIGRSSADRQRGRWKRIVAYDPYPDPDYELAKQGVVHFVDFDDLLSHSDAIIVHCAQTSTASNLFDAAAFNRMKPGSVFVNVARGAAMVEQDLADALESGHLGAAALDVFADEPPKRDSPLVRYANSVNGRNLVFSPHCGGTITSTSRRNIGIHSFESLVRAIRLQDDNSLPWEEWPRSIINFDIVRSYAAFDDWKKNASPSQRWRLMEAGEL